MTCICPLCGSETKTIPLSAIPDRGIVVIDGAFAPLTGAEMLAFEALARAFPRCVTREKIARDLRDHNGNASDARTVDTHIVKMRRKLAGLGVEIGTVAREGYHLKQAAVIVGREEE